MGRRIDVRFPRDGSYSTSNSADASTAIYSHRLARSTQLVLQDTTGSMSNDWPNEASSTAIQQQRAPSPWQM